MDALARHRLLLLAGIAVPTLRVPARVELRDEPDVEDLDPEDVEDEGEEEDLDEELDDEPDEDLEDDEDVESGEGELEEGDLDDEADEPEDEPESAAMLRHRQLQMLGIEARARSNPAPGRQVNTPEGARKYGLPIGSTILPGMRALTVAQQAAVAALGDEDRPKYLQARREGATHAKAMKAVEFSANARILRGEGWAEGGDPLAKKAAPAKAAAHPKFGKPLRRRTPRVGDVAVWHDQDGDEVVGRVEKSGWVTWDGGRREKFKPGGLDPDITLYVGEQSPEPAKKATPAKAATPRKVAKKAAPLRKASDIVGPERKTLADDVVKRYTWGRESVENIAASLSYSEGDATRPDLSEAAARRLVRELLRERGVELRRTKAAAPAKAAQAVSRLTPEQWDSAVAVAARGDEALQAATVPLRSAAERKAYADYVSQYRFVNGALRENAGTIPVTRAMAAERRLAAGLDSAMARGALPQDIQVYRIGGTVEFRDGIPRVGDEWVDHGYVSTSIRPKTDARRGDVQMRILVPGGTRAVATPELDVGEILLDRGQRFRVVRVSGPDELGVRHLDVEVIPPAAPAKAAKRAPAGQSAPRESATARRERLGQSIESLPDGTTGQGYYEALQDVPDGDLPAIARYLGARFPTGLTDPDARRRELAHQLNPDGTVDRPATPTKAAPPPAPQDATDLDSMSFAQLMLLAQQRGITIPDVASREDLLRLLRGGASALTREELIDAIDAKNPTAPTLRRLAEAVGLTVPANLRNAGDITWWLSGQGNHPGLSDAVAALPSRSVFDANAAATRLVAVNTVDEGVALLGEFTRIPDLRAIARVLGVVIPANVRTPNDIRRHIATSISRRNPSVIRSADPEARHRTLQLLGIEDRALGEDTNLGGERLHLYWTKGEGLAKWRGSPHPWTTLRRHLLKYMSPGMATRAASKWFQEVFGYASGSDLHRVGSGKPPRGKLVGPG